MFIPYKRSSFLRTSLLLFVLLSLVLSSCSNPSSPSASSTPDSTQLASSGTTSSDVMFTIAQTSDIQKLTPFLTTDTRSSLVIGLISEGLLGYEDNYVVVPKLATSLGEYSEDGLTLTFPLREGVKFHDGSDFTSEDVKYTFEAILNPATKSNQRTQYDFLESIETPDEYTVVFHFKYPYGPALHRFTMGIVCKSYVEENGFAANDYTNYNGSAVGTGPFKMVEWQPSIHVLLEANEEYWDGAPEIKKVRIRPIPDNSVRLAAFEQGEVDFVFSVTPEEVERISANEEITLFSYPPLTVSYMTLNTQYGLLSDLALRQAITYATDKQTIIDAVLMGYGQLAVTPYAPSHEYYKSDIGEPYPFDPAKAIETLENAGYTKGNDGIYVTPNGERASFKTFCTTDANPVITSAVAQLIQAYLKDVGIELEIVSITQAELYDLMDAVIAGVRPESDYPSMIGGMSGSADPDIIRTWHSKGQLNDYRYMNPELDALLEQGTELFTYEDRKPVYDQVQELLATDLPCLFLYYADTNSAVSNKFEGMNGTAYGQIYKLHKVTVAK